VCFPAATPGRELGDHLDRVPALRAQILVLQHLARESGLLRVQRFASPKSRAGGGNDGGAEDACRFLHGFSRGRRPRQAAASK